MPAYSHRDNRFFSRVASTALASICTLSFSLCSCLAHAQGINRQNRTSAVAPGDDRAASTLPNAPESLDDSSSLIGTPKRVVLDFVQLVQFPGKVRGHDGKWLIPLTAATITSFALDEHTMSDVVTSNPSTNNTSGTVSDGLRYGFIAAPILMYGAGLSTHNEHLRETGLLGGEAMADAYIAGDLIKLASFRERPNTDRSEGSFYRTSAGYDSSFISGHSLTAWSSAAVIAAEYPKWWVQIGAYTAASGVSLTRVLAQQHFPSDVVLGSAAGWLIGRYVYRHHAHAELYRTALREGR